MSESQKEVDKSINEEEDRQKHENHVKEGDHHGLWEGFRSSFRKDSSHTTTGSGDQHPTEHDHFALKDVAGNINKWIEKEEELQARIRAKQASLAEPRGNEDVRVLSVLQYLASEVKRFRLYRAVPGYLLFLILLVTTAALTSFEGFDSKMYFRNLGMKKLTSSDEDDEINKTFLLIDDEASFYTWFTTVATRIWTDTTTSNNIRLGYLHTRQWRVRQVQCESGSSLHALSPNAKLLTSECYPSYSASDLSYDAYGPALQYLPNSAVPNSLNGVKIDGLLHNYEELDAAFSLIYRYTDPLVGVQTDIAGLSTAGWIDRQTRAISIGLVTYNQPDATFVHIELCVEITESGVWLPSARSRGFTFFSLQTPADYTIIILDGLILLYVLFDTVTTLISIKRDQELNFLGYFAIGAWNIYILAMVGTFGYYYYLRISLWVVGLSMSGSYYADRSTEFGGDSDKVMQQLLTEYGTTYVNCFNTLAVLMALAWLRLFHFVQYNERINSLTETMKIAITNLLSLALIFVFVLVGYSMWGHLLYGHHIEDFRDLVRSSGTLLRALVLGSLSEYKEMSDKFSIWTAFYFTTFFVLGWLMILNIVLAVITGAYMMVQEHRQGDHATWTIPNLYRECKKWWLKLRNKHLTYMVDPDHPDYDHEEKYLNTRVDSIRVLKVWYFSSKDTPEYISKEKLKELLGGPDGILCEASLDHIFKKAAKKQAMGTHAIRLGERWAAQLQSRTRAIEGMLGKMQKLPLEKIKTISNVVEAMDEKVGKTQGTVEEVSKKTGGLVKEVRGISHSTSTTAALENKFVTEMKKVNKSVSKQHRVPPSGYYDSYYSSYQQPSYNYPLSTWPEEMTAIDPPKQSNRKKKKSKQSTTPAPDPTGSNELVKPLMEDRFIDPALGWDQPDYTMTVEERRRYLPDGKLDV